MVQTLFRVKRILEIAARRALGTRHAGKLVAPLPATTFARPTAISRSALSWSEVRRRPTDAPYSSRIQAAAARSSPLLFNYLRQTQVQRRRRLHSWTWRNLGIGERTAEKSLAFRDSKGNGRRCRGHRDHPQRDRLRTDLHRHRSAVVC